MHGPTGVGKSRLAEECLARAVSEGFRGARVTASSAAAAVPLGAIAHLVPSEVDLSDPVTGFEAAASALSGPARTRRWAVWVDDLQLLDAASAMLLRQLMDIGVIRLIATIRTGEPAGEAVDALTRGDAVHRLDLETFNEDQVDVLLRTVLGGPVTHGTLKRLYTVSGGNALYLREMVHGALAKGALTHDGEIRALGEISLAGTPQLTELIKSRLATVGPDGWPVLELIALCEPLPLGDAEAMASSQVLAELEFAGLIGTTRDQRRTTLTLAHPLYGEIIRAGLPALRRRALLLQQSERTESRGARRRDDALHTTAWRLSATGTADPLLLARAAVLARRGHDYQQVTTLLQAIPDEHHSASSRMLLGEALFQLGRCDHAETILAGIDTTTVGEQDQLAITLVRTANLLWSNTSTATAFAVNDAALESVTDPRGRRTLRLNEGFMRIAAGQIHKGLDQLDDMQPDVDHEHDVDAWLRGALMKPVGLALVGRTREAMTWAERAHTVHRRVDEHALVSHPSVHRISLVLALTEAGQLEEAYEAGKSAYADLPHFDKVVRVWLALCIARASWLAGHPTTARRWWAEAATAARSIDLIKALRPALSGIAACAAVLGDLDAADAAITELTTYPPLPPGPLSSGEVHLGQAWVWTARGQLAKARAVLTKAAQAARDTGHVTGEALLLTDIARLGGAKDVTTRLSQLADTCDGAFAPARAHLATALAADDPGQLLTAADELEEIGADLLAAEAATAAVAGWHRLGLARNAAASTRRASALLTRCEGARTPPLATSKAAAPLTTREREIALMAATGHSSKDIAAALTLSVRTVDNHLHHSYTKLGVTNRRELAEALGVRNSSSARWTTRP